jgi:hypothetical protein
MKIPLAKRTSGRGFRLALLVVALCALAAMPWLVRAQPQTGMSITVTNNSNWQIRHLYLTPADSNDWGADQLNDSILSPGASVTISADSCGGSGIKVISEDTDGCFLSKVVACADTGQWIIGNNATPNCGN